MDSEERSMWDERGEGTGEWGRARATNQKTVEEMDKGKALFFLDCSVVSREPYDKIRRSREGSTAYDQRVPWHELEIGD
jgi:hypothetical protein